jgi:hypothetical protein
MPPDTMESKLKFSMKVKMKKKISTSSEYHHKKICLNWRGETMLCEFMSLIAAHSPFFGKIMPLLLPHTRQLEKFELLATIFFLSGYFRNSQG